MRALPRPPDKRKTENAPDLVVSRYVYFDTVAILTRGRLGRAKVQALERTCGSVYASATDAPGFRARYAINQPTPDTFALLQQWLPDPNSYCINSVHRALDLIVANQHALARLWSYLKQHLTMRWHGRNNVLVYTKDEKQTYYARAAKEGTWHGRQIVAYGDKPCRLTGEAYCVHLEFQRNSAKYCKSAGFETIADLASYSDYDHRQLWRDELALRRVDLAVYERGFNRVASPLLPAPDKMKGYMAQQAVDLKNRLKAEGHKAAAKVIDRSLVDVKNSRLLPRRRRRRHDSDSKVHPTPVYMTLTH